MAADQVTLLDQPIDGCPQRQAGDAEADTQLTLGRDGLPDAETFDQLENALPGLVLLTQSLTLHSQWYSPPRLAADCGPAD